jgi:hypothetical protein
MTKSSGGQAVVGGVRDSRDCVHRGGFGHGRGAGTAAQQRTGGVVLLSAILLLLGIAAMLMLLAESRARDVARAGFVGSAACGGCHAREYADWRDSDHARAMAAATPASVLGDFSGVSVTDGRHGATFLRDGARFVIRTDGPGGTVADVVVSETFGVDPLQQYLALMPDGRRQALPWAWDSRPREDGGQRWYHLMPGEMLRAGDPMHWIGRDKNWNFMCASCHSTGLVRGYDAARDRY